MSLIDKDYDDSALAQPPEPPAARMPRRVGGLKGLAERNALLALLVAIIVFFSVNPASSKIFFTAQNASVLLGGQSVIALLALAAILPLVTGYFDFSLGTIAASTSVLVAGLMSFHHTPLWLAIVIGVVFAAVIGSINGVLVTRFGLNPFVTTLGMSTLLGGAIQWYTGGQTILLGIDPALPRFGGSSWLGVPRVVYVVAVIAVVLWYVLAQTPYGRRLYAIGSNSRSARLVGIRVNRSVWSTFLLAGTLSGIAGVLQLARTGSATADTGTSLLFAALAAAFLGATAVVPGFFNVIGTIIGVLFVSVAVSGLTLSGASAWVNPVFNGAALLIAVGLSHFLVGNAAGRADDQRGPHRGLRRFRRALHHAARGHLPGSVLRAGRPPGRCSRAGRPAAAVAGHPGPVADRRLGGGTSLTSKVAIVGLSNSPDADVDYLFLQLGVDQPTVSDQQNCGNILSGVGPFAVERGLVPAVDGQTTVRIRMVNSDSIAVATFPTPDGHVEYRGGVDIAGVPGTAAPIVLASPIPRDRPPPGCCRPAACGTCSTASKRPAWTTACRWWWRWPAVSG